MTKRLIPLIVIAALVLTVLGVGLTQLSGRSDPTYSADVIAALNSGDTSGFARALTVRDFSFPRDYGAHPDFQTEWWYYTGNVATAEGRRFGYQLTIFRRALEVVNPARLSEWGTNQLYFAHFTISDIQSGTFYDSARYSRGAAGLAGATADPAASPSVRVWIEDWSMTALSPDAALMRLKAVDKGVALDVTVHQVKPPTLQGDRGLSAKSLDAGNASYYYSLSRLMTEGTITINGTTYPITGNSWKDHEYSTSVLSKDATGWDWFSLQLDDNRELMLYRIRRRDGSFEPTSDGTLINADGSYEHLTLAQYTIEEGARWTSPRTGAVYPAKWRVVVTPKSGDPLTLTITPLMPNQEVGSGAGIYWEGANQISGTQGGKAINGFGYVELTGYYRAEKLPTR